MHIVGFFCIAFKWVAWFQETTLYLHIGQAFIENIKWESTIVCKYNVNEIVICGMEWIDGMAVLIQFRAGITIHDPRQQFLIRTKLLPTSPTFARITEKN